MPSYDRIIEKKLCPRIFCLDSNVSRGSAVELTIHLQHGLLFVVRLPFLIAKREKERYDSNANCNDDNSPDDTTTVTHNINGSTQQSNDSDSDITSRPDGLAPFSVLFRRVLV